MVKNWFNSIQLIEGKSEGKSVLFPKKKRWNFHVNVLCCCSFNKNAYIYTEKHADRNYKQNKGQATVSSLNFK